MKTLLVMRHGKSSWKNPGIPDHERPLNKQGKEDVPGMGKLIKAKKLVPQRIIFSSAVRATQTATMVQEKSGFKGELTCLDSLYLAEPWDYLEPLQSLPNEVERVMVVGHNPGLEGLVQILSGQIVSLSAGAIAQISLPILYWNEFNLDCDSEIDGIFSPRDLDSKKKKRNKEKSRSREKKVKGIEAEAVGTFQQIQDGFLEIVPSVLEEFQE